jgi:type I restriction enzyme M protein
LNASKRLKKGKPKNYIPEDAIRPLAAAYLKGEAVDGEIAIITRQQAEEADYNLSPSRYVGRIDDAEKATLPDLIAELLKLDEQSSAINASLARLLAGAGSSK